MSNNVNPLAMMAVSPMTSAQSRGGKSSSWFEVMAEAWGKTLDAKANEIETAADELAGGNDKPAHITKMTALTQAAAGGGVPCAGRAGPAPAR